MAQILIIDSDNLTRTLLAHRLGEAASQVWEAENGVEGLRICREEEVDVVVAEILLPEQDGLAFIRSFRHEFPHVKVIVLSALKGRAFVEVWDLGVERIFMKPFQFRDVLVAVRELLAVCVRR